MIDFIHFVKHFNPYSPHHLAAMHELFSHLPPEQKTRDAEWVSIYNEECMEMREGFFNEPSE